MDILAVYLDLDHCPFSFNSNSSENLNIHPSRNLDELKSQLVLPNETYDFICVSDSLLQYWKQQGFILDKAYFANWLRLLKPEGVLHLENMEYISYDELGLASLLISKKYKMSDGFGLIKKSDISCSEEQIVSILNDYMYIEYKDISSAIHTIMISWALENHPRAVSDLTCVFLRQGWYNLIQPLWNNFLAKQPTVQNAIFTSLNLLLLGNYSEGFKLREQAFSHIPNERRCNINPPKQAFIKKRWNGENLENKTFVIWSEFGLGDEIMFTQLAYLFKHTLKVKTLIVIVQKPIFELVKTHPDIDQVIEVSKANDIGHFDYWDWPHALLSKIEFDHFRSIPKRHPYLFADASKQSIFSAKLKNKKKFKIGLVWRGNKTHENDRFRSIHDVNMLDTLLSLPNIEWYCLQKELNDNEKNWLKENRILTFSSDLGDFTDTAALASLMDLIISVDTSVVHLAGALNIPTFLMLPYPYDWRWGLPHQQNLWYPSIRTFFPDYPNLETMMPQVIPKVKEALIEFMGH